MKKVCNIFLVLLMFSVVLASCDTAGSAKDDSIKIGYLVHITGDSALWGMAERDGAQIAADEINAAGGILGKKLDLQFYDGRGTSADSVNAVKKAIEQDKIVALLGSNLSGPTIAVADIAANNKVPQIASFATNTMVTQTEDGKVRPWSFRLCFTDPYQGRILANYAVNTLGIKNAAILYDVTSDYSIGITKAIEDNFLDAGGTISAKLAYKSGDVDFRSQLTSIKEYNPDAIFLPNTYKENALITKQAYDLGMDVVFLSGDSYSPTMFEISPDLHDYYTVNHFDWGDPALAEIKNKYVERYKNDKPELNVVMGYDMVYFIKDVIEKAGTTDADALRSAIENATDIELTHAVITIDPATHNPLDKDAVILKLSDGVATFVERYSPKKK
ncbi:MAG: ABC transporter substrate-binding protein [Chloroflexi bacterium]|nr:ABC transporter substrate-binding protein [Chloroflexota bacterium]